MKMLSFVRIVAKRWFSEKAREVRCAMNRRKESCMAENKTIYCEKCGGVIKNSYELTALITILIRFYAWFNFERHL